MYPPLSHLPSQAFRANRRLREGYDWAQSHARRLRKLFETAKAIPDGARSADPAIQATVRGAMDAFLDGLAKAVAEAVAGRPASLQFIAAALKPVSDEQKAEIFRRLEGVFPVEDK
jgi:hypothetical protein